jgi:acetyl esterase/lipase
VPFRPDWQRALGAVVDAVAARPDVDARRIVVIGESWGGYLVPGLVAHDRRVAACVLDPPQLSLFRAMLGRLPLPKAWTADLPRGPRWLVKLLRFLMARVAKKPTAGWALRRGMLAHGVATPWDYFVDSARYEQTAIVGDMGCPTLVCDAAGDDIAAQAREFYDRLRCDKTYLRFIADEGAGEHCVMGNRGLYHARVFDWLDGKLAPSS